MYCRYRSLGLVPVGFFGQLWDTVVAIALTRSLQSGHSNVFIFDFGVSAVFVSVIVMPLVMGAIPNLYLRERIERGGGELAVSIQEGGLGVRID
jgi:hypothetical protein